MIVNYKLTFTINNYLVYVPIITLCSKFYKKKIHSLFIFRSFFHIINVLFLLFKKRVSEIRYSKKYDNFFYLKLQRLWVRPHLLPLLPLNLNSVSLMSNFFICGAFHFFIALPPINCFDCYSPLLQQIFVYVPIISLTSQNLKRKFTVCSHFVQKVFPL